MNTDDLIQDDRYADARDDYRNGFLDAITHSRGQRCPTQHDLDQALLELEAYRRFHKANGHHLPPGEGAPRSTPAFFTRKRKGIESR